MNLSESQKNLIRSLVTTLLVTFLTLVPVSSLAEGDFSWVAAAVIAAIVAALRTLVAYLDPGNTSFGFGSGDTGA